MVSINYSQDTGKDPGRTGWTCVNREFSIGYDFGIFAVFISVAREHFSSDTARGDVMFKGMGV